MKWDGIRQLTTLGKVPLFVIYCLLARMARRSLAPPRERAHSFRPIIGHHSVPLASLKDWNSSITEAIHSGTVSQIQTSLKRVNLDKKNPKSNSLTIARHLPY
jgi:hypothetical protein